MLRACMAALLATAASCGGPAAGVALPDAVIAGQELSGDEAHAAFLEWAEAVSRSPKQPLRVDYAMTMQLEDATVAEPVSLGADFIVRVVDEQRARVDVEATVPAGLLEAEPVPMRATLLLDGETAWGWAGPGDLNHPQYGEVVGVRVEQAALEQAFALLLESQRKLLKFATEHFAVDAEPPPVWSGYTLGEILHPASALRHYLESVRCRELRYEDGRVHCVLGLPYEEGSWLRQLLDAVAEEDPPSDEEFQAMMEMLDSFVVRMSFDPVSGVLLSAQGNFDFVPQDFGLPAEEDWFRVRFTLEGRDQSARMEEEMERMTAPDELEAADYTEALLGYVELFRTMMRDAFDELAAEADPDF